MFGSFVGFVGYFWFLWYFQNFSSNIKVYGQNNVIFELLQQKWCRIIMSFRQNTISGPETCQIGPKLWLQSCPDLLLPVQEDKSWSAKQASFFFLQKLHLSNVRTYSWLHKLRNTQGKIPPCTWNISRKHTKENRWKIFGTYIYICKEYIRNTNRYS